MTQRKAKYDGTCQICGNLQRAPGGLMAKHGYQVPHGYFIGTCHGSDNIPFEQSKELLEAHIVAINKQAEDLDAYILGFKMHPARIVDGKTLMWKDVPLPKDKQQPGFYTMWYEVEIKIRTEPGRQEGVTWYKADYLNPYTKEWTIWERELEETEDRLLHEMVKPWLYSKEQHLVFLRRHLVWQRERAKNWKLLPLPLTVPELDGKDFIVKHTTQGYVRGTEGRGGWNGFNVWYTEDRALAKRYTELGANQMMGKVRGRKYPNHKAERF